MVTHQISHRDLCRKHGFSDASYYLWRSKFGGMSVSDAKRLKELEIENSRLKKLLADALLENEVTREVLRKTLIPTSGRPLLTSLEINVNQSSGRVRSTPPFTKLVMTLSTAGALPNSEER